MCAGASSSACTRSARSTTASTSPAPPGSAGRPASPTPARTPPPSDRGRAHPATSASSPLPAPSRSLDGHLDRIKNLQTISRATHQLIDCVLWMGHQAEHVARLIADPRDVVQRAVEVLPLCIAQDDLASRVHRCQRSLVGVVATPRVLRRDAQPLADRAAARERAAAVGDLQLLL